MNKLWRRAFFAGLMVLSVSFAGRAARAQETTPAATSTISGIKLPAGAVRIAEGSIPNEIKDALNTMMKAGGDGVKRGRTEVLAWTGGGYKQSKVPQIKSQVGKALQDAGWTYEEGQKIPDAEGFTMVSVMRTVPTRKALIGFWASAADALLLGWTEMLPANNTAKPETAPDEDAAPADNTTQNEETAEPETAAAPSEQTALQPTATGTGTVIEIGEQQRVVNVMKTAMPKLPTFTKVAAKPGMVRGYVKDAAGKPLVGARIGVRSTAVGGAETSASGKTDDKGYYEIMVPWGAAGFYNAGYAVDYGEGRAALGLYPADGEADEFASPQGHVENWVLLSYGIADRDGASDQPQYLNNYFGGAVMFEFHDENSMYGDGLAFGTEVEISLIPQGPLFDGRKGKTITLHKTIKDGMITQVYINNIPVGTYKITATTKGGKTPLHLREVGPDASKNFGLDPKQASGEATLLFRPYGARAESVTASHGNWSQVEVIVSAK